jgi:hypothetical protein
MFLGSRATKYALTGEPTAARALSTRQLTTLCLSSRPGGYAKPSLRIAPKHVQAYRVEYVPALSVRWNSTQSNTDDSSSPTFRKWGFDDVHLSLSYLNIQIAVKRTDN